MRKALSLMLFIIFLIAMISCGGSDEVAEGNLMAKLPKSVTTIGHINVKKAMGLDVTKQAVESQKEFSTVIEGFDNVYIGISDLSKLTNANPSTTINDLDTDFVVLMSGEYTKDDMNKLATEEMELNQDYKNGDVEGKRNEQVTMLYISDKVIAICSNTYVDQVIESVMNDKNTIDTDSQVYKSAQNMKANLMWITTNLEFLGEQDLAQLGLPNVAGITKFKDFDLGISEGDEKISVSLKLGLDNSEVAKGLADGLNSMIPMMTMFIEPMLKNVPADAKKDVTNLITNTKLKAEKEIISTNMELKTSTIEALSNMAPALMGGM